MKNIEIYTKPSCGYCGSAKSFLNQRGLNFVEYNTALDSPRFEELLARTTQRTFPQIFINGEHIGGFEDLVKLDKASSLNKLNQR